VPPGVRFRNGRTARIRNAAKTRARHAIECMGVQRDSAHLGKGLAAANEVRRDAGNELA